MQRESKHGIFLLGEPPAGNIPKGYDSRFDLQALTAVSGDAALVLDCQGGATIRVRCDGLLRDMRGMRGHERHGRRRSLAMQYAGPTHRPFFFFAQPKRASYTSLPLVQLDNSGNVCICWLMSEMDSCISVMRDDT